MITEKWKDIIGYKGYYMISNQGNVKSLDRKIMCNGVYIQLKEKIIKSFANAKGYRSVLLSRDGIQKRYWLHRLVAIAFIPNPGNKPTVNHKKGLKAGNGVSNLEWATQAENNEHSYKVLGKKCIRKKGSENKFSKKIGVYHTNGDKISEYTSVKEAAKGLGVSRSFIYLLTRGKRPSKKYSLKIL